MWRAALSTYLKRLVLASAIAPLGGCPVFGGCPDLGTKEVDVALDGGYQDDAAVGDGGALDVVECDKLCAGTGYFGSTQCRLTAADNVHCSIRQQCIGGRRPAGLRAPSVAAGVGGWFAAMAHLEAASVPAFERLAGELAAHGAPEALVLAARRAALDEKRHARAVGALARRFGAFVPAVEIAPVARRSLAEIAVENAAEGCVGETWGATVALHQAQAARDPRVRAAMARIADDEARHAELAWRVARWAEPRLSSRERRAVADARRAAAAKLRAQVAVEPAPALRAIAGLPSAERAAALHGALTRDLWAA